MKMKNSDLQKFLHKKCIVSDSQLHEITEGIYEIDDFIFILLTFKKNFFDATKIRTNLKTEPNASVLKMCIMSSSRTILGFTKQKNSRKYLGY